MVLHKTLHTQNKTANKCNWPACSSRGHTYKGLDSEWKLHFAKWVRQNPWSPGSWSATSWAEYSVPCFCSVSCYTIQWTVLSIVLYMKAVVLYCFSCALCCKWIVYNSRFIVWTISGIYFTFSVIVVSLYYCSFFRVIVDLVLSCKVLQSELTNDKIYIKWFGCAMKRVQMLSNSEKPL